jgi:hypothetical protein
MALLVGSALWSDALLGQPADQANEAVRVGDRWVYDTKDEITGFPKATYSHVVTEVSPKEVVVNLTIRGQNGSSLVVYDHDWNRIEQSNAKFRPNDGQGIRLPLAVGKEWRADYEARATQTGAVSKGSVLSKVVGREMSQHLRGHLMPSRSKRGFRISIPPIRPNFSCTKTSVGTLHKSTIGFVAIL